ncbi:MAG TPA: hypothetical protein VJO12_10565 [Stellaceae bacterium]|nr:hypothetical protein [Stellaceae bacterium]
MDDTPPPPPPPKVPPVEPELLGTAMFLFAEYLQHLADEAIIDDADDDADEDFADDEDEGASAVNMRDVLDLFAEELGTSVPITLNLYMRVTALFRLLAASPSLARLAADNDESANTLSETALVAAARLDLHVARSEGGGVADFDPRQFREALTAD